MAHILRDCFLENNIAVELWDVDKADEADILHSIGTADAVLVGSSTKYADMTGKLETLLRKCRRWTWQESLAQPSILRLERRSD